VRSLLFAAMVSAAACNTLSPKLTPVPPVQTVPADAKGHAILVADDPVIETRDPVHIQRAKDANVPHDYKVAMIEALKLAGFRVVLDKTEAHELEAKLALAVDESTGKVRQTYRCAVKRADGTLVQQVDWAWPEGTYVGEFDVYDFATHNLASEVARSRSVLDELRKSPSP